MKSPHLITILQALFVTFLWSTSWVFIKIGLEDIEIPPLFFAGLRYGLAFMVLLAYGFFTNRLHQIRSLEKRQWYILVILGIVLYAVTQGTQFLALVYLPSAMLSLLLNFTTIAVAFMGIILLKEHPSRGQWVSMLIFLVGVLVYFYPLQAPMGIFKGLVIGIISMLANAVASVLGRHVNRELTIEPFTVTLVSMGIGSFFLLTGASLTETVPQISLIGLLIITWLAVVNTAFAYTLWNITLRKLRATESSIIANTMLIQIAVLAWIFLDEKITIQEGIGLLVAAIGIIMVQVRRHVV